MLQAQHSSQETHSTRWNNCHSDFYGHQVLCVTSIKISEGDHINVCLWYQTSVCHHKSFEYLLNRVHSSTCCKHSLLYIGNLYRLNTNDPSLHEQWQLYVVQSFGQKVTWIPGCLYWITSSKNCFSYLCCFNMNLPKLSDYAKELWEEILPYLITFKPNANIHV